MCSEHAIYARTGINELNATILIVNTAIKMKKSRKTLEKNYSCGN